MRWTLVEARLNLAADSKADGGSRKWQHHSNKLRSASRLSRIKLQRSIQPSNKDMRIRLWTSTRIFRFDTNKAAMRGLIIEA